MPDNNNNNGFSLLELLIVIAIIGTLAMIAFPSYNRFLNKTRRVDGQIVLMTLAGKMEQYYADNHHSYAGATLATWGFTATSPQGFYALAITNTSAKTFTLTAQPIGVQQNDKLCGTLTLNQLGQKGQTGTGKNTDCW